MQKYKFVKIKKLVLARQVLVLYQFAVSMWCLNAKPLQQWFLWFVY